MVAVGFLYKQEVRRSGAIVIDQSVEVRAGLGVRGHMPALDGLRGVAVASVAAVFALHHHPDVRLGPPVLLAVDRAAELGWSGVSLFFALSGFLITGILWDGLGRPQWWREFYIRRSLRIFPLYYFVLFRLLWSLLLEVQR